MCICENIRMCCETKHVTLCFVLESKVDPSTRESRYRDDERSGVNVSLDDDDVSCSHSLIAHSQIVH